jgi:hypothetical protein
MCETHMGPTPMKYFSPLDRNHPAWEVRVRTLEGLGPQEKDPTIMAMASYLLAQTACATSSAPKQEV